MLSVLEDTENEIKKKVVKENQKLTNNEQNIGDIENKG